MAEEALSLTKARAVGNADLLLCDMAGIAADGVALAFGARGVVAFGEQRDDNVSRTGFNLEGGQVRVTITVEEI